MLRKITGIAFIGCLTMLGLVLPNTATATDFQNGDVLAGVASGTYNRYDSSGTFVESLVDGLGGFTTGCAANPDGTKFYTTNFSNNFVIVYDTLHPHNILQSINTGADGGATPESVVFDAAGNFYVGTLGGGILKYDSAGVFQQQFSNGRTDWMDLAIDQTTMFITVESRTISRWDVGTDTALADFATLPGAGTAFALRLLPPFDGSGGLIVADNVDVKRLDGGGAVVQTYDVGGEDGWFAMNLDADGTSFWAGSFFSDNFYKFDIATGAVLFGPINAGPGNTLFGLCVVGEVTGATSTLSLDPVDATNFTGEQHTVTATVLDGQGDPRSGVEVTFDVASGPNAGTGGVCSVNGDCTTDANGQVSFTYLGDGGAGMDVIVASILNEQDEVVSATARKTWVELEICPTNYRWSTSQDPPYMRSAGMFTGYVEAFLFNNSAEDLFNVTATISCVPINVTIIDGDIAFGDIPAGTSAWSLDDFCLQIDLNNMQDPELGILYTVEFDDAQDQHHVVVDVPKYCGEPPSICPGFVYGGNGDALSKNSFNQQRAD